MLGLHSFDMDKKQILGNIEEFEKFCLGKRRMSPEELRNLNEELSLGAIVFVGKHRFDKRGDDTHLLWTAPDKMEHDLGPIEKLNVRDCPGFHRTRSLALGHELVETASQIAVPTTGNNISVVKMKDGTVAYGLDYKMALRNAALKMRLKSAFARANPSGIWKIFYGNA